MAEEKKKNKRGGARPNSGGRRAGAGRKPDYLRKLGLPPLAARVLLARVNEEKLIDDLLKKGSMDVRLRVWQTLREMVYGRAPQAVHLGGGIGVANVNFEARDLAALTPEQLDEQVRMLEDELGLAPAIEPAKAALPQLPAPMAPEQQQTKPADPPSRYHILMPPPGGIPSVPVVPGVNAPAQAGNCDKHGPFTPQSKREPICPTCKYEWEEQNQDDQRRLNTLMPGEPLWTRNR